MSQPGEAVLPGIAGVPVCPERVGADEHLGSGREAARADLGPPALYGFGGEVRHDRVRAGAYPAAGLAVARCRAAVGELAEAGPRADHRLAVRAEGGDRLAQAAEVPLQLGELARAPRPGPADGEIPQVAHELGSRRRADGEALAAQLLGDLVA